jgi:phosphatidate cytidylyltransferase
MIWQLLTWTLGGFALGIAGMAWANRRTSAEVARQRWIKLAVYFVIVHGVLAACALGHPAVLALGLVVAVPASAELWRAWQLIPEPRPKAVVPIYLLASTGFGVALWQLAPAQTAFVYLVVASFDGFSQVAGQALGRHPLAPRVSPNKTVEGLMGGLLAAALFGLAGRALLPAPAVTALALGAALGAAALAGDLGSSWVKRQAGLKDYATTLPGQGGFLDRFNSFMAACALVGIQLPAWLP